MKKVNINKLYHCNYALSYHFVFVTKYRRKVLTEAMLVRLREILDDLLVGKGGRVLEMNGEADHIHLLLEAPPKEAPSVLANSLKTVSSRLLRKEFGQELARTYRKPVLWSRTYFVTSCGGAPLEVIKQYIQQQDRPI